MSSTNVWIIGVVIVIVLTTRVAAANRKKIVLGIAIIDVIVIALIVAHFFLANAKYVCDAWMHSTNIRSASQIFGQTRWPLMAERKRLLLLFLPSPCPAELFKALLLLLSLLLLLLLLLLLFLSSWKFFDAGNFFNFFLSFGNFSSGKLDMYVCVCRDSADEGSAYLSVCPCVCVVCEVKPWRNRLVYLYPSQ